MSGSQVDEGMFSKVQLMQVIAFNNTQTGNRDVPETILSILHKYVITNRCCYQMSAYLDHGYNVHVQCSLKVQGSGTSLAIYMLSALCTRPLL